MLNRVELKTTAKSQLKDKWGKAAIVTLIYLLISIGLSVLSNIPYIGRIFSLAQLFLLPPLVFGYLMIFVSFVKDNVEIETGNLFKGFNYYAKSLGIYFWEILWVFLWSLLLFVPGIIKALSYSQAFFIVVDNPNVKVRDALKISILMTEGYKGEIFVMGLSFIGWCLLGMISAFIGFIWITPYMLTTYTNMFYKLKEQSIQSGKCTEDMFNGTTTLVS